MISESKSRDAHSFHRIPACVLPLFLPITLVLVWHIQNHGWPNDDAANYATTGYEMFDRFETRGVSQGLIALLDVRGWRPTIFPILLVPFLLMFQGNIPLAVGGVLWMLYCLLTLYAYKLCRLFLCPARAVIPAAVVATYPVLVKFATVFFAELAWVCFAIAWTYHLLQSDQFRSTFHSLFAGIFLGLMVLTRPAESIAIAAVPVSYFVIQAVRHHAIRFADLLLASPVVVISGGLLGAALYFQPMPRFQIWFAAGVTAVLVLSIAARRRSFFSVAHLLFWTCLCALNVFWWAGFERQLYEWVYTTSFGPMARITAPPSHAHILTNLAELVGYYGAFQIWWLIGATAVSFAIRRFFRKKAAVVSQGIDYGANSKAVNSNILLGRNVGEMHRVKHLALMAAGTLVPILLLYWLSSTGDPRRAMVGITLAVFSLSIAAVSQTGPIAKLEVMLVGVVPLLQIWHALPAYMNVPAPVPVLGTCCGPSLRAPFRGEDGNDLLSAVLVRKIPKNTMVAAYTLALFSFPNRVYEPAALKLALVARKAAVDVGYLWDEGAYEPVIRRLAQSGYRFLLLDRWDDQSVRQSHMPYVHFTASLLDSLRERDHPPRGLRLVESFTISGREQLLFEITAQGFAHNALPQDALSWFEENIAAARNGARAVTNNHQTGFDYAFLNDDRRDAWGSAETQDDSYAGVVLPKPQLVQIVRIVLFSPGDRAHSRDLSIVAADNEGPDAPDWRVVRSRIQGQASFSDKITVPALPDNAVVTIEIDLTDPNAGVRRLWGVACLSSSRGYARNYLSAGAGVYIRELQMRAVSTRRSSGRE